MNRNVTEEIFEKKKLEIQKAETDIGNLGARTAKNLVEDDEQFMQHQMAAAIAAAKESMQPPIEQEPSSFVYPLK